MNKLTKKTDAQFESAKEDCVTAAEALTSAIEKFNEQVEAIVQKTNEQIEGLYADVEAVLSDYNTALVDAKGICEEVFSDQESYYDDRSERWQESERGEAYREWADEWENAASECDEVSVEGAELLDAPTIDAPEMPHEGLDELTTEFEF